MNQRFEITIDGQAQSNDFATQAEADTAAQAARQANPGKSVVVRPKPQATSQSGQTNQPKR